MFYINIYYIYKHKYIYYVWPLIDFPEGTGNNGSCNFSYIQMNSYCKQPCIYDWISGRAYIPSGAISTNEELDKIIVRCNDALYRGTFFESQSNIVHAVPIHIGEVANYIAGPYKAVNNQGWRKRWTSLCEKDFIFSSDWIQVYAFDQFNDIVMNCCSHVIVGPEPHKLSTKEDELLDVVHPSSEETTLQMEFVPPGGRIGVVEPKTIFTKFFDLLEYYCLLFTVNGYGVESTNRTYHVFDVALGSLLPRMLQACHIDLTPPDVQSVCNIVRHCVLNFPHARASE